MWRMLSGNCNLAVGSANSSWSYALCVTATVTLDMLSTFQRECELITQEMASGQWFTPRTSLWVRVKRRQAPMPCRGSGNTASPASPLDRICCFLSEIWWIQLSPFVVSSQASHSLSMDFADFTMFVSMMQVWQWKHLCLFTWMPCWLSAWSEVDTRAHQRPWMDKLPGPKRTAWASFSTLRFFFQRFADWVFFLFAQQNLSCVFVSLSLYNLAVIFLSLPFHASKIAFTVQYVELTLGCSL